MVTDSQDKNSGHDDAWRWHRFEDNSPLQVAWSAFDRMSGEPVLTDSWPVPGVRVRSWGDLRTQLLDPSCSFRTVDAIWGWLIERARQRWHERGGQAVMACVGLAVPMLVQLAGRYIASGIEHRGDLESEILAGFLEQVRTIEVNRPHLWPRLWFAMMHVGRSWARQQSNTPRAAELDDQVLASLPVQLVQVPAGHPELLLADAVVDGVITAEAAELIAVTRWESRSLSTVADQKTGGAASYERVRKQRWRAENKLVPWLTARLADPDTAPASTATSHPAPAEPIRPDRHSGPTTRPRPNIQHEQTPAAYAHAQQEVRRCA